MTDVWPGDPYPLGAKWDGYGTNFSLFSEHAEAVELCLFDDQDQMPSEHVVGAGAVHELLVGWLRALRPSHKSPVLNEGVLMDFASE